MFDRSRTRLLASSQEEAFLFLAFALNRQPGNKQNVLDMFCLDMRMVKGTGRQPLLHEPRKQDKVVSILFHSPTCLNIILAYSLMMTECNQQTTMLSHLFFPREMLEKTSRPLVIWCGSRGVPEDRQEIVEV